MIEPLLLALAFLAGLIFRRMDMPPLLGFLVAGFLAGALELGDPDVVKRLADIGVVLLLFTIGLKLKLRELLAPQIWASASLHALLVVPLTAALLLGLHIVLPQLSPLASQTAWVLAFALSFSSTVFAVKIFEQRGEGAALHAQIAVGILIVQDILAVAFLVLSADQPPSAWAFTLLALPLLRKPLLAFLNWAGHGELLVLYGLSLALAGAWLFEFLHLKAGLGALLFGMLLANSAKSVELYKSLVSLKDIFLTAFFLSIGYYGLPNWEMVGIALLLALLILLRPLIYLCLLLMFRLRARTGLLAGLSLGSYSEFGLIVAALAVQEALLAPQWLTILAMTMALSLFVAAFLNRRSGELYNRFGEVLQGFERSELLAAERPADLGDADIVILGMGRVGSGAYDYLDRHYPGRIVGVEESGRKAEQLRREGLMCISGDASDRDFLERADLARHRLILVCLSNHSENVQVVKILQSLAYRGRIAVISRFPDQQQALQAMGCISFNLYAEAGYGFAERVLEEMDIATT